MSLQNMKTKKQPEQRIFVVVPSYIKHRITDTPIQMECGRLIAQVAHVVSKLKLRQKLDPDIGYTTIVLQVPNEEELKEIATELLLDKRGLPCELFHDTNTDFYGTPNKVLTGVATLLTKKRGKSFFHNIGLWNCNK